MLKINSLVLHFWDIISSKMKNIFLPKYWKYALRLFDSLFYRTLQKENHRTIKNTENIFLLHSLFDSAIRTSLFYFKFSSKHIVIIVVVVVVIVVVVVVQ